MAPDTTVARTGVPVRAEIVPSERGAAPSRLAATCVRDEPMSQVSPFVKSTQTNAAAAIPPRAPAAGPYTTKTLARASMKPVRLVISSAGRTSTIATIGMQ